ncbi:hypothetical protein [Effusibacillus consociatus]|uniref:Uncharacterized protein n=1 Tax=Effusibacillus consociatus TaxID=1117041 RepID=A0ABV9Q2Y8_9BACL
MKEGFIGRTCQTLSLPLYALMHDSIVKAMKGARVSRQVALAILGEIPKLSLSSKEQDELQNAKGAIELEDSFGSGNFFVIDAGSKEAFVCTDKKNADYLNQLLESHSNQDFLPAVESDPPVTIQAHSVQLQSADQAQTQVQQNQTSDQDLLLKMQLVEMLTKGNEQKNKRGVVKLGQRSQQKEQNVLQQVALLELLRGADSNELLKQLQMVQLIEQMSQSGNPQQGKQQEQPDQQNQMQQDAQMGNQQHRRQPNRRQQQNQQQQQGQDLLQTLQELQLLKALQSQS